MKEEGFVNKALKNIKEKDKNARFLANQTLFNGSDKEKIEDSAKASVAFSLNVFNEDYNDLSDLVKKANNVRTIGGIKKIIIEAEKRIDNRNI